MSQQGKVVAIYICPVKGKAMRLLAHAHAIAGFGLEGDRYSTGHGSWQQGVRGKRQVTLINGMFFKGTDFKPHESRRNIITEGIELMSLIERNSKLAKLDSAG